MSLRQRSRKFCIRDSILILGDGGVGGGNERGSEGWRAIGIEKTLHFLHELGPAFGGEVALRFLQTGEIILLKGQSSYHGFLN